MQVDKQVDKQITLRRASTQDFDYCANLYFAEMEKIIRELNLDWAAQMASFRQQWEATQVQIITFGGVDVGWLQSSAQDDVIFLGQLFVDRAFQRRGIGTEVIRFLIGEATRAGRAMTLGVVKTNPAMRLYKRLGFRIADEDDRKFYMKRDPNSAGPISS